MESIPRVCVDGVEVRSTLIREALGRGDVATVASMLGRPYSLSGPVVPGRKEGRRLGFPTANIACPPEKMLPAAGVYAGVAHVPGLAPAAIHIGPRPHYGLKDPTVEAHVLDFDGDLRGRTLRIDLIEWLRGLTAFAAHDELAAQIARDVERVREVTADALASQEVAAS